MDNPYQAPVASSAPPPLPATGDFRDARQLTLLSRIFLWLGIGMSALAIIFSLQQQRIFAQAAENGMSVDDAYIEVGLLTLLAPLLQLVVLIATYVVNGIWIHRAAWNARALVGQRHMEFTPRWTVGWYFIPFANLVKPYQAMKDVWIRSFGGATATSAPGTELLILWWWLWLLFNLASNIAGRMSWRATTLEQEVDALTVSIVSDALNIPLSLAFLAIVTRLYRMQAERHASASANSILP